MDTNFNLEFKCANCYELVKNNYTMEDLHKHSHLDFKCQNCGYDERVKTAVLLKKLHDDAEKMVKKL